MDKLIVHEFPAEWESMEILPIGDVHIGDPKTDESAFKRFLSYVLEKENRYVLLIGDLMNNALKTSVSNVYNETMNPHEQKKWLIHELRYIQDRILCIVPGNHEYRSVKDDDVHLMEDIAMALNKEDCYREEGAFLKICLGRNKASTTKRIAYTLCAIHGTGGGKKSGSAVNNIEDFAVSIDNLDIITMGHVHKQLTSKPSKIVIDVYNNKVTQREYHCVIAGAWQDYGGYGFRKMYRPTSKNGAIIKLNGREKSVRVEI